MPPSSLPLNSFFSFAAAFLAFLDDAGAGRVGDVAPEPAAAREPSAAASLGEPSAFFSSSAPPGERSVEGATVGFQPSGRR